MEAPWDAKGVPLSGYATMSRVGPLVLCHLFCPFEYQVVALSLVYLNGQLSWSAGSLNLGGTHAMLPRTPWRPSKIPPLSPHTLSITIRLPVSSTLLAISWAVYGVRGQLFNPSHCRLPCFFINYLGLALQQACEERGPSSSHAHCSANPKYPIEVQGNLR